MSQIPGYERKDPELMVMMIVKQERMGKAKEMRKTGVNGTAGRNMLRLRVGLLETALKWRTQISRMNCIILLGSIWSKANLNVSRIIRAIQLILVYGNSLVNNSKRDRV
jgi:hypothetical protein